MAIVKVYFRESASRVIRYVFNHSQPGDPVDSENCPPNADGAITEFQAIRDKHDFKEGNNEVVHIIQSWNEADSKKLTPEVINGLGRKLIEERFKDHQFVIVTHTETGKVHNHIVVATPNIATGKQIEHKFNHLHALRKINDRLCLEKGLQIPNQEATQRKNRIPQNVQNMIRHGKQSWLFDIVNKADVARNLATGYDQYVDYLDAFGIKARVEEKNISYFYPGRSRPKRGDKLGRSYDKPGLEEQFQKNEERFRSHPELRTQLNSARFKDAHDSATAFQKAKGLLSQEQRDYSQYTQNKRRTPTVVPLSERELSAAIIPSDQIRKAKRSISDYCKENNIALAQGQHGHTILRDKPHIVIQGEEAFNTKNGVRGSLIDFVAAHHRLTLLQAVAHINGVSTPADFEKHFGSVPRKYTSFYIPKPDQMPHTQAAEHLGKFLKQIGGHSKVAEDLLRTQRAEVSKSGTIRLFSESDSSGALEFTSGFGNAWQERKQGELIKPFYKHPAKRGKATLFLDPKSYLSSGGSHPFDARHHRDGILVLMEPNKSAVDHYLQENPKTKKIQVVTPKGRPLLQTEIDFFGVLKPQLHNRGIELVTVSHEKAITHDSPSIG